MIRDEKCVADVGIWSATGEPLRAEAKKKMALLERSEEALTAMHATGSESFVSRHLVATTEPRLSK
jgi:hypothetical protein